MKHSGFLRIISYILLSITIAVVILSTMYIGLENSSYYNIEKYFSSEEFVHVYMLTLGEVADELIHNNSNYENVQDGDKTIYYLYDNYYPDGTHSRNYSNYTQLREMNFLLIYQNKAITNVSLPTIDSIKEYINTSNQERKQVNISNGEIQADSKAFLEKGKKYFENFKLPYYTTETENTDIELSDGTHIEYITPFIDDFEIYSSYTEELYQNENREIVIETLKRLEGYKEEIYILLPISSMIMILLIFYLIISIGHQKDEKEIVLNDFDKIPFEIIFAIGFIVTGLSFIPFAIGIESNEHNFESIIPSIATIYIVSYVITAIVLHTTIKRIKAKSFWRTTILGKILIFIKKHWDLLVKKAKEVKETFSYSTKLTTKILVYFGGMLLIAFLIMLIFNNSVFGVFLEIILIGMIFYKILKIAKQYDEIENKLKDINEGNSKDELKKDKFCTEFQNTVKYINEISEGVEKAIQERMKSERLKAELITNVSHDIKTPLTSIINYVDLLKKEEIQNEKEKEYIDILDNKSQRLKKLTEDLVEASKVSTGNISLNLEKLNIVELIKQASGEFEDRFQKKGLEVIIDSQENDISIMADSRYIYRVIENLFSNISKYALENSRVYIDIKIQKNDKKVVIEIKNISKDKLNISAEELMQRFVRGDKSRTTEGSGLGISIAQNLTELQKGKFNLRLDGDLFKVELIFDII